MSVNFLDVPGSLPSPRETVDFTTDTLVVEGVDPVRISIRFPALGSDETVFWDGEFCSRYSKSTHELDGFRTFHIRRNGGWPRDFIISVSEGNFVHAVSHELDGEDEIAGQKLRIATSAAPAGYTPAVDGAAAPNADMLGAHLNGISAALSNASSFRVVTVSGTSYTLVAGDYDGRTLLRCTNAATTTISVPTNAVLTNPTTNRTVHVRAAGAGQVQLSSSATINSSETLKLRKQGSSAMLMWVSTDVWDLTGDLEAA